MSLILGINAYHADASACIVRDGVIIAAAEEERFRRIKHWAGFPSAAVGFCLREARAELADVDAVAVNSDPRARLLRKVGYIFGRRLHAGGVLDRWRHQVRRTSIGQVLQAESPGSRLRCRIYRVEHHLAHLMSAFAVSGFDDAATVSVDGFGDFASVSWGIGAAGHVVSDGDVLFPHSLGVFYQAMTQYLGFPGYGDEYKMMGLAPYGRPRFLTQMRDVLRLCNDGKFTLGLEYFRHQTAGVPYVWEGGAPYFGSLYSEQLEEFFGPARRPDEAITGRHRDIACSVQAMYEEALFHLLSRVFERYQLPRLAMAGGCAMNAVANGKITLKTGFRQIYIPPAPGDAGGAVGAALQVAHEIQDRTKQNQGRRAPTGAHRQSRSGCRSVMNHAQYGPSALPEEMERVLSARAADLRAGNCTVIRMTDEEKLCTTVARAISRGAVVGWFQGRMEWGPRALGNRSILCDPRRSDARALLNSRIKMRESFRPFAPSVLAECVADWFEGAGDVPFMMEVHKVRADQQKRVPAITHVDGSGRLQTVSKERSPLFWRLIDAFRALTGVPMLLNTSFNENEPIVCQPCEALDCFLRTGMDMLVMGQTIVRRGTER